MPTVLVILAPGAEEIETMSVADILVRAGCDVTVAGAEAMQVTGSRGLPLAAHTLLADVAAQAFDCVYVPGGGGSAAFCSENPAVQDVIEGQLASGRWLAIICASPQALVPRQLATDRRVTSYPGVREKIEHAVREWVDDPVVIDGNLVTSQGPGTSFAMGLTLASLLVNAETARQVAAAMLTTVPEPLATR